MKTNIFSIVLALSLVTLIQFELQAQQYNLQAQQKVAQSQSALLSEIKESYGFDQILVNGKLFEDFYRFDLGYPFYGNDEYITGNIFIQGRLYRDLLIKYNLFDQDLLVKVFDDEGKFVEFLPPMEFVQSFSLGAIKFSVLNLEGTQSEIYEVVYEGKDIACYYHWKRGRTESHHNRNRAAYQYHEAKKKSFVVMNNEVYKFSSKGSFVKLFPKTQWTEIKTHIKEKKINFKTVSRTEMQLLLEYCEQLQQNNLATR